MTKEEELEKREKAFRANTGEGYYYLALYYEEANDEEPTKYSFRSLYFYFRAWQLGYADGYNGIGAFISHYDGVKNNITRAKAYYKQAIEKGSYCANHNYFLTLKQEEYPTCLKLIVTVTGNKLDSVYFSELVNLSSTTSWLKGDDTEQYPYSLGRKKNCWQYEFDNLITRELEPLVNSFKEIFGTKVDIISKYIQENDLKMELDVMADINYGIIPSYYMDKEFMSLLVQMNADINFEQEYFDGFDGDFEEWKVEQKKEAVRDNMLLYTFDDEVMNRFVYDEANKRIELSFEGYYDVVNEEGINRECVLIIEQWDKAMSKRYPSNKFENIEGNFGIISMIVSMEVMKENICMVVSTINSQHYEIIFERASIWLLLE